MGTLRKSFDDVSLHIRDSQFVGMFSGSFEAENGVILSITLDGTKWGHDDLGRKRNLPVSVEITPGDVLWDQICDSLGDFYGREIEATDPIASQGDDEHRIGKFEATGRR